MVSARALIIIALRTRAIENAVQHLRPESVTVVTSQESLMDITDGCAEIRRRVGNFRVQPLDEAMRADEAFKRFDHELSRLQRRGYEHKDILLDATGGTTPLRVGAALAALMRNVTIVHQRVKQDQYVGGVGTNTLPKISSCCLWATHWRTRACCERGKPWNCSIDATMRLRL